MRLQMAGRPVVVKCGTARFAPTRKRPGWGRMREGSEARPEADGALPFRLSLIGC